MNTDWVEYKCKSGETLFIYNKVTGEHRWSNSVSEDSIMYGQPVVVKEFHTICTQTDDYGCDNGCLSLYVTTDPCHALENSQILQPQSGVSIDGGRSLGNEHVPENNVEYRDEQFLQQLSPDIGKRLLEETPQPRPGFLGDSENRLNHGHQPENILKDGDIKQEQSHDVEILSMLQVLEELNIPCGSNSFEIYTKARNDSVDDVEKTAEKQLHATKGTSCPTNQSFECPHCEKQFRWKSRLICHLKFHSKEKPCECSDCGKKFVNKGSLKRHLKLHSGERPFECSYCGKKFTRGDRLNEHFKTHPGVKPCECSYCEKKFAQNIHLQKHLRTHSHSRKKPVECSHCQKQFRCNSRLIRHLRVHSKEKPFECSDCGKKFAEKGGLKRHLKLHSGEKPFGCSYCEKKFARRGNLKEHHKIHSGEKPFECSHCGKKFAQNNNLRVHLRTHSGEKPFECFICEKKLIDKRSLNRHLRVHSGEKPFECSHCKKKFARKDHLRYHDFKTHSGDKNHGIC